MKILLLGANGQVGWELQRALSFLGELSIHDKDTADFEEPAALVSLVHNVKPSVIVNAAAYTAVDQAETDVGTARKVNAEAVASLAEAAEKIDAWLIHYSTDYVFDGTKQGRYLEDDIPNPKSVYGKSKREGELAVINSGCKHLIFRTSWVFASRGNNFAKTMIKLARERDELKVVSDQIGAPTSAELIADVTALAIYNLSMLGYSELFDLTQDTSSCHPEPSDPARDDSSYHSERSRGIPSFPRRQKSSPESSTNNDISGIYHLTANGETSWHGFAKHVIAHAEKLGMEFNVKAENIEPITTEQFPRPAERPLNSRMDTKKLQSLLNIDLPDWQVHVDRMVTEFIENQL
jgi:dTDP-4-dehydrorhamnose reductase